MKKIILSMALAMGVASADCNFWLKAGDTHYANARQYTVKEEYHAAKIELLVSSKAYSFAEVECTDKKNVVVFKKSEVKGYLSFLSKYCIIWEK